VPSMAVLCSALIWCTSRSMCAVPSMAVLCSALIWRFLGMLLRYCLSDFEMVLFAPVITGITFVFYIPHALYFRSKGLNILQCCRLLCWSHVLSAEIAVSVNTLVPFTISQIKM